jgi:diguanylate cyclase (GGDEF)-like protein/PAS domain S-box-containing protein
LVLHPLQEEGTISFLATRIEKMLVGSAQTPQIGSRPGLTLFEFFKALHKLRSGNRGLMVDSQDEARKQAQNEPRAGGQTGAESGPFSASAHLRALLESTRDLIWSVDREFRLVMHNRACADHLKKVYGDNVPLLGARAHDRLPPDRAAFFTSLYERALVSGPFRVEYQLSGGRWVELSLSAIVENGEKAGISALGKDITWRKQAELAASESEVRHRAMMQMSSQSYALLRLSDLTYVEVNNAFTKFLGYTAEEVLGKTPMEVGIFEEVRSLEVMREALKAEVEIRDREVRLRKKNGGLAWGLSSVKIIEIGGEPHIFSVTLDITWIKEAEDKIASLSYFDSLTGLPNRRQFREQLEKNQRESTETTGLEALLFINIDDFSAINDMLGHAGGDHLLREAGDRLREFARDQGLAARMSGDEFAYWVKGLPEDPEDAVAAAMHVGTDLLELLDRPYQIDDRECVNTCCIGISLFLNGETNVSDVLKRADMALHEAKDSGRNTVRVYSHEIAAKVRARVAVEDELRLAVAGSQFQLYYQPQIDCGRLVGAEALLRWNHPIRGVLAPAEFIYTAERTGIILPIGEWVLEKACRQLASWARQGRTELSIGVNISALQLQDPGFVVTVSRALTDANADATRLCLEITESTLVENTEDAAAKIRELRAQGVKFALDDFGTGYSSLAYLRRLPIDYLKIDRSFVRDIDVESGSTVLAEAITSLGQAMHIEVIAEGVETRLQEVLLARIGCLMNQGYLYGMPMPIEEFEARFMGA